MAQWSGSDSGILRKNIRPENHEELLVFGYSCKLFRDDEKALYIDQGKHLIPWMGDETLKIDRYDCRGALSDLTKYEASREGFDAMRWLGLSDKERQLEELCDKERYYSLEINEEEEEMYKEEEQKRQKTNTFQYSYDVPMDPDKKEEGPIGPEANEEEEYIPPPILDVPVDIDIPKTVKENARIEKTAKFVCKQGPQMEILIKAKQGNNPQFSFLNQGDKLYKFYRHVLAAFKNGRYQGYESILENKSGDKQDMYDAESGGHYLHPSLLSATQQPEPPTTIAIPQVPYKPSANCTYSQLVSRIQGNQCDQVQDAEKTAGPATNFAQMTYEQQQYYQYYYAQQYYEYYKQMALFQQGHGGNPGQFVPPADFQNLDPNLQNYIQQIAYSQYLHHQQQQQSENSYAQIVSNVNKEAHNPYAANVPQLPQNIPQKEEVELPKNSPNVVAKDENVTKEVTPKAEVVIKKPLLSLAAYGSGTDSESEDSTEEEEEQKEKKEVYKVPAGDIQVIIDKMALYVSKNGEQFETLVKARGDPRFHFLNDGHEYHKYYKEKIRELRGTTEKEDVAEKKEIKEVKPPKKEKKVIAPVCFSIKKAKDEQPKEIKSALPVEESDEEETDPIAPPAPHISPISTPAVTATICIDENSKSPREVTDLTNKEEKEPEAKGSSTKENKKNGILDVDDPILEMIELTSGEAVEDKKDAKRAEDKIKDKLAAAARERLASASRDRALQLERKKKAAAFLKLKSAETNAQGSETTASEKSSPSKPSSRRSSVEIIEILSSPPKRSRDRSRSRDREKRKDKEMKERRREERQRKTKERERSREKKRSKSPWRESMEEETENKRRKEDDKKEKKKKSHKRKHSKSRHESRSKKKSKKRHRRSESESSSSNSS
ncbi:splicing factor, suppressor of white-apricot homolog [Anoplophora glabripennis]|nr:splicing factor, suppressor of white-apricot homolog [Anoplophora glabripennis]